MQHPAPQPQRPPFNLSTGASGTTATIELSGEIDVAVALRVTAACDEAIATAPETLVLDLTAVDFIDSSGLHAIIAADRHATARSVRLIVIPGGAAVRTFGLCGLSHLLAPAASAA